ncbi:MAG: hypothetical protein H6707_02205 [Deltaproteobacteria bacterium]|nr:hypothetical protein [Deltaproteobacteria bacterium]
MNDDDLIDDQPADIEQRFRELEAEEEMARMRGGRPGADTHAGQTKGARADDQVERMKAVLDGTAELRRYIIVVCPSCGAKNRTELERLRKALPRCGACKGDLATREL